MTFKTFILPSMAKFFFSTVFIFIAFFDGQRLLSDCDTGYHIRAGEYIINSLSVPEYDIFSYITPPLPWTAHEWLSEVIMASVHKLSGLTGIVIFFSFMIALISSTLFKMLQAYKKNIFIVAFLTAFVIVVTRIHWLARPHIFSLLLFLMWYYVLDSYQYRGKNYLVVLPVVMLLWVNLHGSFIIAFAMTGIYFLGNIAIVLSNKKNDKLKIWNKAKWFGIVAIICLLVSLVNPYGYHILSFPFQLMSSTFLMNNVSEFVSTPLYRFAPFTLFLYLIITVFAISTLRLNLIESLLILLFTHLALYSIRFVPLFAFIAAPILLRHMDKIFSETHHRLLAPINIVTEKIISVDSAARGFFWPVIALVIVCLFWFNGTISYSFDKKIKPVQAIDFLKTEQLQGNMFNHREFGDYIIFKLWPQYHVFADGRSDMYGEEKLKEYFKVERIQPGWDDVLKKYHINWIIHQSDSMLSLFLMGNESWKLIYADDVVKIFVRNTQKNRYIINKYGHMADNLHIFLPYPLPSREKLKAY